MILIKFPARKGTPLAGFAVIAIIVSGCSEQKTEEAKEPPPVAPQTDGQQGMSGMSGEKSAEPPQ